jgi:hypothetical protein
LAKIKSIAKNVTASGESPYSSNKKIQVIGGGEACKEIFLLNCIIVNKFPGEDFTHSEI